MCRGMRCDAALFAEVGADLAVTMAVIAEMESGRAGGRCIDGPQLTTVILAVLQPSRGPFRAIEQFGQHRRMRRPWRLAVLRPVGNLWCAGRRIRQGHVAFEYQSRHTLAIDWRSGFANATFKDNTNTIVARWRLWREAGAPSPARPRRWQPGRPMLALVATLLAAPAHHGFVRGGGGAGGPNGDGKVTAQRRVLVLEAAAAGVIRRSVGRRLPLERRQWRNNSNGTGAGVGSTTGNGNPAALPYGGAGGGGARALARPAFREHGRRRAEWDATHGAGGGGGGAGSNNTTTGQPAARPAAGGGGGSGCGGSASGSAGAALADRASSYHARRRPFHTRLR